MSEFQREVRVNAFKGETRLLFLLHGEEGTVQLVLRVTPARPDPRWPSLRDYEMKPWDIGLHWRKPMGWQKGDGPIDEKCGILGGVPCWYDGSGLAPEELWKQIMEAERMDAEELIWEKLEEWYRSTAEEAAEAEVSA